MTESLGFHVEEEVETYQDDSEAQKLIWVKESILLMLAEYLKRKEMFANAKGLAEKRLLWDQIRQVLHDAGFTKIKTQHVLKKFCLMRRIYKEFCQGLSVGQRLYGFLDLLGEILDDDPYINQAKPTKRMMQTINRKLLKNILNGTVCEDDEEIATSLPRWVTVMIKRFNEDESERREERWKLADEVIALEKKKVDCLETLIFSLRNGSRESLKFRNSTSTDQKKKISRKSKMRVPSPPLLATIRPKILRKSGMMDVDGATNAVELTLVNDGEGRLVGQLPDGEIYQVEGYFEDPPGSGIDLQALVAASGIILPDDTS